MEQSRLSKPFHSGDWLYLSLVLMVILAIAFLLPLRPNDYWWYVRLGQDTLQAGAVPTIDTFSYTQYGVPFIFHSWLSAVIFALLNQAGGVAFTVLVRGLVIALAYGLIWYAARWAGTGTKTASLVTLLAALATSNNWTVRPQMFTYALFALALLVLYGWQNGDRKAVWLLPLVTLLWVNLHGSFVMLFLLLGAGVVFGKGDRTTLVRVLLLCLAATLINPRGIEAWGYVLQAVTVPSIQDFATEWQPPVNLGWQMNLFFGWLLLFIPLAAASTRKLSLLEWVWFLGFGWLALSGVRHVVWFVLVLAVPTASLLTERLQRFGDKPASKRVPAFDIFLAILFILLPVMLLPGIREIWWQQAPPTSVDTPIQATDWLADHPKIPGPIWSEMAFSAYMEYALPSRLVWSDPRLELFSAEQWERYRAISSGEWNWQILLDEEGINLLMVSPTNQAGLSAALEESLAWCELYRDETAIIYQRKLDLTCPEF
jgi:hypothetical protein